MKKSIVTLLALLIANVAVANAPDSSLRPVIRSESVEHMATTIKQIKCLALNVYHEARGENLVGQIAVAHVTINRVKHDYFPNTVCSVVWQRKQFSWTHDKYSDRPRNKDAWITALDVADLVYNDHVDDPTGGALFYHAKWVRPVWRHRMDYFKTIGVHKFYHWDGNWNND